MKTLIITLVAALAGGAAAAAQADGYQTYQRVVLGGSADSASPARAPSYGSYARYHLHHGASLEVALAEARAIGEVASEPRPPVYAEALSGYDAYRHVVLGQSLAEIHASRGHATVVKVAQAR